MEKIHAPKSITIVCLIVIFFITKTLITMPTNIVKFWIPNAIPKDNI